MGKERKSFEEGRKFERNDILKTGLIVVLLIIAAPTILNWFDEHIDNNNSNQNNNFHSSQIENETMQSFEKEQLTEENIEYKEITATDFSIPTENSPIESDTFVNLCKEYFDKEYFKPPNMRMWKYYKNGYSFIFHEFWTGNGNMDGDYYGDRNKQGVYCIETKQWVLTDIQFNYYYAKSTVYIYENGQCTTYGYGKADSSDGWEMGFEECSIPLENALKSLGLTPINTLTDTYEVIDQQKAFELIGYTPE